MDDFKSFLKGLFYLGAPLLLGLLGNAISQKREQEVFELKVQEAVDRRLKYLLESPKE